MFTLGLNGKAIRCLHLIEDVLFITIYDKRPVFWTIREKYVTPLRKDILCSDIGFVQINSSDVVNLRRIDEISIIESLHPRSRVKKFAQIHTGQFILPVSEKIFNDQKVLSEVGNDSFNSIDPLLCTFIDTDQKVFRTVDVNKDVLIIRNDNKSSTYYTDQYILSAPLTLDAYIKMLSPAFELTDTGYLVNTKKIRYIEDKKTYGDIYFQGSHHIASMSGSYMRAKYGKYMDNRKILYYTT